MRDILHCDLNNFFASVECLKRPELRNVPMVVTGDPKLRHGIVLAKNEIAKKYGIYTPETIYSALKKCPDLVMVKSNHSEYEKYSKIVNDIYKKYTDRVEPFGIDESFLDVTESLNLFNCSAVKLANIIKEDVKSNTGLTISVGVSFNKSLAKLGSDIKKPDAVTEISYNEFRNIIYPLPVEMLLYVGKSIHKELLKLGIKTIGDLATCNKIRLVKKVGKVGNMIYNFANGYDFEEVKKVDFIHIPKSISKGSTFSKDISDIGILISRLKILCEDVAINLRKYNLKCNLVTLTIKDSAFISISRQRSIVATDLFQDISKVAINILKENYIDGNMIRALSVSVSNLEGMDMQKQLSMFDMEDVSSATSKKLESATLTLDKMQNKYGRDKINFASLI